MTMLNEIQGVNTVIPVSDQLIDKKRVHTFSSNSSCQNSENIAREAALKTQ